jgi:hypothetical protein
MRNQSEPSSLAAIKTAALDQLFGEARTHSTWLPEPVPVELLRKAHELARLGPTSANASPARFVFLTTPGAKALLKPVLAPGNVDKTMAAPVTVIIAWDTEFHENLPRLFPHADVRSYFVGNKPLGPLVSRLAVRGKFIVVGVPQDLIPLNAFPLVFGGRSIYGSLTGTPIDNEDTLAFSVLENIRPMIETFPLQQAADAYARMMQGKARFRMVLVTKDGVA